MCFDAFFCDADPEFELLFVGFEAVDGVVCFAEVGKVERGWVKGDEFIQRSQRGFQEEWRRYCWNYNVAFGKVGSCCVARENSPC